MNINNTILVNIKLIQRAINEGFINELSFYYLLKAHFRHCRISKRDHAKQRIRNLTGLSINTISKYFDKLALLRLLQPDCNGWHITSYKRQRSYRRTRITINEGATIYTVKDALYFQILQNRAHKQSTFNSLETYIKGKQAKELPGYMDPAITSYKPYFSIRYVARILNISHVSAFNLLHGLTDQGHIKQHFDGAEFVCRGGDPSYLEDMYDYKYLQVASIYKVEPARYEFVAKPIFQKEMTIARYRKLCKDPKVRKFVDDLNLRLTA